MNEKISRGVNINAYNNMQCVSEDAKPKMRVCLVTHVFDPSFLTLVCTASRSLKFGFCIVKSIGVKLSWELRLKNYE